MTEKLQWMPFVNAKLHEPFVKFIYWSLWQLDGGTQVQRGQYGVQRTEILPGDQDNMAIETQGGPEKHEVTGWLLLSPRSKEDAGEYECHASNSQEQASASEKIIVFDALHEISVKKVCNQSHSHSKQ
ncbi:Insulin-like growth factor-binding protein 7 [Sciurus carolinensis]|uniref:Insulin-like growth factor-binding protein 7 n=1 Tax=Sciurus carolinensis TaxID=30640 RepID=A0AA41N4J8_SCICA|nr:Insulin-like growth factor-binding protein 7 [Sciurus carolinensis]